MDFFRRTLVSLGKLCLCLVIDRAVRALLAKKWRVGIGLHQGWLKHWEVCFMGREGESVNRNAGGFSVRGLFFNRWVYWWSTVLGRKLGGHFLFKTYREEWSTGRWRSHPVRPESEERCFQASPWRKMPLNATLLMRQLHGLSLLSIGIM